ncbi:zinc finger protein LEE1 [Naviculisporaceae sp. PSN 640]
MSSPNPTEYRHLRTGSLNIPPPNGHSSGVMSPMPGPQRFDGPRSPPSKLPKASAKLPGTSPSRRWTRAVAHALGFLSWPIVSYTSHVPCKFFRQGACQAGTACPFSHDLGAAAENICKYFAKGNCKFGPKCANIHVLPDGRRINYSKNGVTVGGPPVALGARVNPNTYHQPSNSALTNSFLRADAIPAYTATSPYGIPDDKYGHQLGHRPSMENGLPTIDTTYTSNPASVYGSPRDEDANRLGLGLSPINAKGLSVLDAPLPASFDSNGISHAARYGPWPSSVPSKFGLESPSQSLGAAKDGRTSETLKLLHTSAFGSDHLTSSSLAAIENGFGSSPPTGSMGHGLTLGGEEYFGKRAMHSSLRYAKRGIISSSAPKIDRDWDSSFLFEEDMVPGSLANEVLTPAEKARRGSTTNTLRPTEGLDPLTDSVPIATKFGSPITGSPSRWGPMFQRQKEEEAAAGLDMGGSFGGTSRSFKHASAFGHVGSPLRNSSLASGIAAELNGDSGIGRPGPGNRTDSGNESLSVLTQQLQRTRIGENISGNSSPHLHPNISRNPSGNGLGSIGSGVIGKEREKERGLERHVSSGSIGSNTAARFNPIDEEDPAFVFNMEEEDDAQLRARKRTSGGTAGTASPLSSAWTYAAAAGSTRTTSNAPGANGARNGGGAVDAVSGR